MKKADVGLKAPYNDPELLRGNVRVVVLAVVRLVHGLVHLVPGRVEDVLLEPPAQLQLQKLQGDKEEPVANL